MVQYQYDDHMKALAEDISLPNTWYRVSSSSRRPLRLGRNKEREIPNILLQMRSVYGPSSLCKYLLCTKAIAEGLRLVFKWYSTKRDIQLLVT